MSRFCHFRAVLESFVRRSGLQPDVGLKSRPTKSDKTFENRYKGHFTLPMITENTTETSPSLCVLGRPVRVGVVTLGCDKNTVDNEYLAGMIERAGGEVVFRNDGLPLDAAVVTTCGFIAAAKDQSIQAILDLAKGKRETGSPKKLYVAGCLSQRYGEEMMKEIPEIDGLVGVGQFKRITEMIVQGAREEAEAERDFPGDAPLMDIAPTPKVDIYAHFQRKPLKDVPYAFLKVSDGCNHACTFCAIPKMKGKLLSVEPEILLAEAKALLARGVKEINLVAQDLSEYGRDRWKDYRLTNLLREICALPGDFWVRCLYYYPGNITDEFLKYMASEPKIVPYLEMPLQHLHPDTLRRMKRPFHEKNTFETVEKIRATIPGVTIRSTVIVGFPGETTGEFNALMDGLKKIRFDRLGAFEYSTEDDTPAGEMPKQTAAKTRAQRWRMVMKLQSEISEELNEKRIGKRTRVLIEGYDERTKLYVARSAAEAPEVDSKVLVASERKLAVGDFLDVEINGATTYDVYAQPVN